MALTSDACHKGLPKSATGEIPQFKGESENHQLSLDCKGLMFLCGGGVVGLSAHNENTSRERESENERINHLKTCFVCLTV